MAINQPATAGGGPGKGEKLQKIVLCHLESLVGLPALNILFAHLGPRIGLVLASHRFGPHHGSVTEQLREGVRRSGWRLTVWLGFDIFAAQTVSQVARWISFIRRESPALATLPELARRHGARFAQVRDVNDAASIDLVRAYAPDLVIVLNFDQILRAQFIALPRLGVINVHPSLLPSLRGPCPAYWALQERRDVSGVSVHLIEDEKIDSGTLIVQSEVIVDRSLSVGELTTRLFELGARALPQAIATLTSNREVGRHQDLTKGAYRGFPDRRAMAASRRQGVRLCRLGHIVRLVAAATGLARW